MFANTFGTHENVECGLICIIQPPDNNYGEKIKTYPIPLESVSIQASVVHAVAQVELRQVYVNKEEQPIEAIYYFPVDSNGGVTHFQAELEGRTIKGVVKPEEEAKAQYDKAVQEKKSAFLVESNKPDIFKVRIGFLKPGCQVKIVIGYVTEVKNEKGSNGLRFFIPTTVSPRYIPSTDIDKKSVDLKEMKFSSSTPAPLTINVNVAIQGKIKSIESPTHKIDVSQGLVPDKKLWTRAIVNLAGTTTDMDRDFVLNIIPEETHDPRVYKEKSDDSTVLMAHLIPSFNLDEQKVELIFLLDRSGSMAGKSIELAKKALKLFLHSLPVDCYFNVVGFGSSFQFLFPESTKYDDGNFKKALRLAQSLDADLGGTEILEPLKEVFNRKSIEGYLRQVFVITDGEVSNTDQVIGFAKAHAHISRLFALGIGDGASHDLVEGLAAAGGGTAAFATYNETIDSKVLQQLKNAIQPSLTNVSITWKGIPEPQGAPPVEIQKEKTLLGYGKPINPESMDTDTVVAPKFSQVPENVPPIFDGSQLLVFGIFPQELPTEVCVTAESPDGPLSVSIKLDNTSENDLGGTGMLHKLAAIKSVTELQLKLARNSYNNYSAMEKEDAESKLLKSQIIEISCKNGIVSKYTSFVAVDTQNDKTSNENWVMQTRYVPAQYSHGWHGHGPDNGDRHYSGYMSYGRKLRGGGPGPTVGTRRTQLAQNARRCSGPPPSKYALRSRGSSGPAKKRSQQRSTASKASSRKRQKGPSVMESSSSSAADEGSSEEEKPTCSANKEKGAIATENDRLHKVVGLQSFDGSFSLNKKFSEEFGFNLDTLKKEMKAKGWAEKAFATALALSYFSEKFPTLKDSWELVALKAKKWLQKNSGGKYDTLIAAATSYIRSI